MVIFQYLIRTSDKTKDRIFHGAEKKEEAINYARTIAIEDNGVTVKEVEFINNKVFSEKIIFDSSED
jgi:hypothetical protein